jgi:lipid A 3-O-deacylase
MSQRASVFLATATVAAALMCGADEAHAQLISEVRVGVLDHDTDFVGSSKEGGVDLAIEAFSQPIDALDFIGSPRVVAGLIVNSENQTNQLYAGLMAQRTFAHDVFRPDDSFYVEGLVAVAYHDGKIDVRNTPEDAEWKSHGSEFLFRTGFGVGYRFNERWSLTATFAHISNANLEQPNQGANDVGLRVGLRF